jgi:hypothetical protein
VAIVYLSVSEPVSGIQFNLSTVGTLSSTGTHYVDSASLGGDDYLVLAFVTTNTTFTGKFIKIDGSNGDEVITNVIASDIDGTEIDGVIVTSEGGSITLRYRVA